MSRCAALGDCWTSGQPAGDGKGSAGVDTPGNVVRSHLAKVQSVRPRLVQPFKFSINAEHRPTGEHDRRYAPIAEVVSSDRAAADADGQDPSITSTSTIARYPSRSLAMSVRSPET
jgi:hypothetical protein